MRQKSKTVPPPITSKTLSAGDALKQAVTAHQAGNLAVAETLYRAILKANPDQGSSHHNLGLLLVKTGRQQESLAHFRRGWETNPSQAQHWLSYAEALLYAGQLKEALLLLDSAKTKGLTGERFEALFNKAVLQQTPNLDSRKLKQLSDANEYLKLETEARQQLEALGPLPQLKRWLGLALMYQSRDREALPYLQSVAEIWPEDPDSWNQLALAQHHLEQYDDAHESFLRAHTLKQDSAALLSNIADNLTEAGRYQEALEWLDRALQMDPESTSAKLNRVSALIRLQRQNEAHQALMGMLDTKELSDDEAKSFAMLLRGIGEQDKAIELLTKQLQKNPRAAEVLTALSHIHLDNGNFTEAAACQKRALEIIPERPEIWASLVQTRKMTAADNDWLATAYLLLEKKPPQRREMPLRFAMGKFCDDTKQYAEAFEHYQRANTIKTQITPAYDRRNQELLVSGLIKTYSAEKLHQGSPGASDSMRPLLIVGMPRSGTSLTEQIIAAHPAAAGAGELNYWQRQVLEKKAEALTGRMTGDEVSGMAAGYLRELYKHDQNAARVVDKMPGNFTWLGLIHTVFPNARILHTMRNPIDTCLSIYFQNFNESHNYGNDLDDLAHYYRQYHRLMAHWRSVLPPDVFLELPYEQLVEDQEGWSRKIIEFIGLEWNESCLAYHKNERKIGTASNWQARQPIYKSSKERWRNYEQYLGPLLPLLDLYDPQRGQV